MGSRSVLSVAAWCVLLAGTASAQVVASDVAVIEDSDGSIDASSLMGQVWLRKALCKFYLAHEDDFDAVFVFTTIPQTWLTNMPMGHPVRQAVRGIGRELSDSSAQFCSKGRLMQAVKMGDLARYPDDPDDLYAAEPGFSLSGVQLMAHEFGHQWLASVRYDLGDGKGRHCRLRAFVPEEEPKTGSCDGYDEGEFNWHWSAYFDSASVMYGHRIEDLGGGIFRLTNDGGFRFSPLDQYLMGLRSPAEVGPMFVVDVGDLQWAESASYPVKPGTTKMVQGQRVDLSVEDVIRAEGPRDPPDSPCHWKAAVAVVHAKGAAPTPAHVSKIVAYANRFETFYAWATDGRGSVDLTIDGRGTGTPTCPAPGVEPNPDGPGPVVEPVPDEVPEWGSETGGAEASDPTDADATADPGQPGPAVEVQSDPPGAVEPAADGTAPGPEAVEAGRDEATAGAGSGGCGARGGGGDAAWVPSVLLVPVFRACRRGSARGPRGPAP